MVHVSQYARRSGHVREHERREQPHVHDWHTIKDMYGNYDSTECTRCGVKLMKRQLPGHTRR